MGFIYKSIVGILFLLGGLVTTSNAQLDKYLYSRKVGESATDFAERHLTDFRSYMMESHGVIEGFWGDESKGKKIIAFFHTNIETEYVKGTVAIFQPVGDGKNYILMYYEGLGGAAAHYKGVISVFFFDANRDGSKELFVLELGYDKIPEVIEQVDENGKVEKYNMNVCCEDIYDVLIIRQQKSLEGTWLPKVDRFDTPDNWSFSGLDNASKVKARLKSYLP